MSLAAVRARIQSSSLWIYRVLTWAVLLAGLAFAAVILVLRYWILPDIGAYRDDIAQTLSKTVQKKVTIGGLTADWNGFRPQLSLSQLVLHDEEGRPALELPQIHATLSWRSAALLQINFHSLEIQRPVLTMRRDSRGGLTVAGLPLHEAEGGGGEVSRWVLGQRDIQINDARLVWDDQMRAAPVLELDRVQLRIVNSGDRHRLALRAVPPPALAAPLDVRADLRGEDFQSLAGRMTGQLFVHVDHVDIAAWRQWIDFPVHFPQGTGALRTWLTFTENALTGVIADAQLRNVRARLGAELPELDMPQLGGRFAWKRLRDGFEVNTRKLTFRTGDNLTLPPVDLMLRLGGAGEGGYARGELQANALELAPLVQLADRLPLPGELRKTLLAYNPVGGLFDLTTRWSGRWPALDSYTLRGRFNELALQRQGAMPGFSGFSGNIDGSEKGGTLHVTSQKAALELPDIFRERLLFDTLTGQIGWTNVAQGVELRFSNFAFSNADLTGTLFGGYRTARDGPGVADLTGHLTRGVAQRVSAYLPLHLGRSSRDWLDRAFTSGSSNDVRFRLKGDLKDFPFVDERGGVFEVAAKISDGAVHYGEGWPRITGIEGDLLFRGKRMDVNVRQATMSNVQLGKVRVQIPDLLHTSEVLQITGEAEGASGDFLDFIAKSPVRGMIDGFTDGMQAQGRGRLGLKLTLPLRALDKGKVSGTFQFLNNRLTPQAELPSLEQVNGRLEFTESSVRVPGATAVFLGGPLTVSAGSQRDAAVSIRFQGRINADALRQAGGGDWLRHARGATEWRGTLTMRNKRVEYTIESTLQGIAVNLPAPFSKPASEIRPLRIERRVTGPLQDRVTASVGSVASAIFLRRSQAEVTRVERAAIRFGGGQPEEPARPGYAFSGTIAALDIDGWLGLSGFGAAEGLGVNAADLRIGELDWFGRTFAALAVTATQQDGALQIAVKGREVDGTAVWRAQGKGRLTARLRRMVVPSRGEADSAVQSPQRSATADANPPELPALDIVVEDFQIADRPLGKLELQAVPQLRDWRIERLRLTNPESTLNLDGTWQAWLAQSSTQVNVRLDVSDAGKFLTRLGYPEGVRRGVAKIEGTLAWAGSPQRLDYPSLTGNFVLDAGKGQFVKLEPGIGKLLGILSLQSLPRRISLDFRDIFSEGLAFDEIVGAVRVVKGVASTDNLRITGPAARIVMSGQVDLARETQTLRVRINPQLSDTVSVAGALIGGPVAGVAAFLAQKLLKDPLDEIAAYEYDVTGNWSDPLVTKVDRDQPAAPTP
jgi:uncharacterized protein (TIGR02099 family)